jgi:hypothetical protein
MSSFLRAVTVSSAAAALVLCGALSSASAAPAVTAPAAVGVADPTPSGPPIMFGPFAFPGSGQIAGGFGWSTR